MIIAPPSQLTDHEKATGWLETLPIVKQMGFDYVVYCYMNSTNGKSYNALTSGNAIGWGKHHLLSSYSDHDPVIKFGQGNKLFIWNSVNEKKASSIVKKIMNERRDHGMRAGATLPIRKKTGELAAWVSLSCNNTDKYLNSIITANDFYEKTLELHIKSVASTLCSLSGMDYATCYAIILADYYNSIETISYKSGFSVFNLQKLFSYLYIYQPFKGLLNVAMTRYDIRSLNSVIPYISSFKN